ncbi:MAG: hypothetical protein PHR16_11935 [Methylovulum sp.]|nr:hypothetical protein [Methylovulum sp.]
MDDVFYNRRVAARYASIKGYCLKCGHTGADWQKIAQNPALFNAVWRKMLGIPAGTMPPPETYRQ